MTRLEKNRLLILKRDKERRSNYFCPKLFLPMFPLWFTLNVEIFACRNFRDFENQKFFWFLFSRFFHTFLFHGFYFREIKNLIQTN